MATPQWSGERSADGREVQPYSVTVGILTALPVELRAVSSLIDEVIHHVDPSDPNHYRVGTMPSSGTQPHHVALLMMPRDGTQLAATCCANMLRTFPNIRTVIMTGIAGGIPRPDKPGAHVRLGDIVVAKDGIVNYTSVRREDGSSRLRGRQGAGLISSWLLSAANELQVAEQDGSRRWEQWLRPELSERARDIPRPPTETDVLRVRGQVVAHPPRPRPGPPEGMPQVHYGVVGSADVLVADENFRDQLVAEHPDMCAVEMEGSGIAASTAAIDRTWFMVRGVADYGERSKDDRWHAYASYTAAAYLRALLEAATPTDLGLARRAAQAQPLVGVADQRRLDALLRTVPSDLDIAAVWRRTVPVMPVIDEHLNTAAQAYHHLAELNADVTGLDPAILFLAHLSDAVRGRDAGLAERLWAWVDEYTRHEGTGEALRARLRSGSGGRATDAGPMLLIDVAVDGINRGRLSVVSYLQDGPGRASLISDRTITRADLEAAVSECVAEAERVWARHRTVGEAGIEFVLPWGLMNERVQWFRVKPRFGEAPPLGVLYAVAVRSRERMRESSVRRAWAHRWGLLDRQPFSGSVLWGTRYQRDPTDVEPWSAGLSGDDRVAVVVLSEAPDSALGLRELFAALSAGVPVILWDQRPPHPSDAATDEALDRLSKEPGRLPAEMRALRVEAERQARSVPDHCGRSLALLWDDPNRALSGGVRP